MIICRTMGKAKIAITVDEQALAEIDRLVSEACFLTEARRSRMLSESAC
jgi:hypothetical protein